MKKDKTGVQLDLGHTSTDDFITKKYVLPLLKDEKIRNKLQLNKDSNILLIGCEGDTDQKIYQKLINQ